MNGHSWMHFLLLVAVLSMHGLRLIGRYLPADNLKSDTTCILCVLSEVFVRKVYGMSITAAY